MIITVVVLFSVIHVNFRSAIVGILGPLLLVSLRVMYSIL